MGHVKTTLLQIMKIEDYLQIVARWLKLGHSWVFKVDNDPERASELAYLVFSKVTSHLAVTVQISIQKMI
uniref:Uncharacterized protein n=1 Tax=Kryptolebias marmoratus TaxID=37003 RepID=A0A3Q2ZZ56_KRYMA